METTTKRLAEFVSATEMLREDHRRVKALFREFQGADERTARSVALRCLDELQIHSTLEEKLFYPALRRVIDDKDPIFEAYEAHKVVDQLVLECRMIPFGRRFCAKFQVIIDNVLAHMKEEEAVLLPAAEASRLDLAELGRDMALLKYKEMGKIAALDAVTSGGGLGLGTLLLGAGAAALAWLWLSNPKD